MTDKAKAVLPLAPARRKEAAYVYTTHAVQPEFGTPFEAVLEPSYWSHVARHLKPFDEIVVRPVDDSFYAKLLVRDVAEKSAIVEPMPGYPMMLTEVAEPIALPAGYEIKWRGPQLRFAVIRAADGADLKNGFQNRPAAEQWLTNHMRGIKAA